LGANGNAAHYTDQNLPRPVANPALLERTPLRHGSGFDHQPQKIPEGIILQGYYLSIKYFQGGFLLGQSVQSPNAHLKVCASQRSSKCTNSTCLVTGQVPTGTSGRRSVVRCPVVSCKHHLQLLRGAARAADGHVGERFAAPCACTPATHFLTSSVTSRAILCSPRVTMTITLSPGLWVRRA